MPIELEFKFVLRKPKRLWSQLHSSPDVRRAQIFQGYLSKGGRVRSRDWTLGPEGDPEPTQYIFTYKHDLQNHPGCLEIEQDITTEDFNLAWEDATHKIDKTRFLLPCDLGGPGVWEVDFFRDKKGMYLAMAEFEVLAGAGPPDRLHPLVQEFLLYRVPEGDARFTNRKLSSQEYVTALLKEIV